jgi:hypothetical protein
MDIWAMEQLRQIDEEIEQHLFKQLERVGRSSLPKDAKVKLWHDILCDYSKFIVEMAMKARRINGVH